MERGGVVIAAPRHGALVTAAFSDALGKVRVGPAGRWEIAVRGAAIVAREDDGWLALCAPIRSAAAPLALLEWNAALPGRVKFALSEMGEPELRAEIPLDADAGPLVAEAVRGFDAGLALLRGEAVTPSPAEPMSPCEPDALDRLCAEAGWPCSRRADGACAVELECPGAFLQATVAAGNAGIHVSAALASCEAAAPDAQRALAIFLLESGAALRFARPVCASGAGKTTARFEVVFSPAPTAAQLAHALASLSLAAQFCLEESRALQDPAVAREFLALHQTTTRKEAP
jgi:hypothetical protein